MKITLIFLLAFCAQVFTIPINTSNLLVRATELNKRIEESVIELSAILMKLETEHEKTIKIWNSLSDQFNNFGTIFEDGEDMSTENTANTECTGNGIIRGGECECDKGSWGRYCDCNSESVGKHMGCDY